ncbi:MAG: hypothetical protein JW939_03790, partial [Candidatus Thermoplasmatota archaeon]|nr:hypothetical protein [Candidatus Thermoplasmatota archaeon]
MSKPPVWIVLLFTSFMIMSSVSLVSSDGSSAATRGEIAGVYVGEEIYRSSRSLPGGMASGDPDHDGDIEVVFADFEGNVIILEPRGDGGFDPVFIWQVEGPQGSNKTLFDLIVADIDPRWEGQEIITAGDAGTTLKEIYMIHHDGSDWVTEVIHRGPFRTFDLELGDIDPAPGMEILMGSFQHEEDFALHYLYREGAQWIERSITTTEAVKAIEVADADPTVPGEEIWACIAGWNEQGGVESHLVEIHWSGSGWVEDIIYTHSTELISNVRIGEFWSEHDGNEVIITELSGWCRLMYWEEGEFRMEDIFQADTISGQSSGLEGLAIGDFNPLHTGDEAVVTGYYNKVTQVIEIDGMIVADSAWAKDVQDPRLEISGVEVGDVCSESPGNEILVASLQGWIELLRFEEDGLGVGSDAATIKVMDGGDKEIYLEISPEGMFTGAVSITAGSSPDLTLSFDDNIELKFQETEMLRVLIEADDLGSERTSYVNFTVSGGRHTARFDLTVEVSVSGIAQLVITPQAGNIYREGVNTFSASVSLVGGQNYDHVDLTASTVTGLAVNVNTPISPGSDRNVTISVEGDPSPGFHTISITGSHQGTTVAIGSFVVNVISLSERFKTSMRQVTGDRNRYVIDLNYTGSDPVQILEFEMKHGSRSHYKLTRDLRAGDSMVIPLSLEEGDEGNVVVTVRSISGNIVFQEDLGEVKYVKGNDGGLNVLEVAIIVLLVLIGIVLVYLLVSWISKPKTEDTDEGDIEAIYGTSPYKRPPRSPASENIRGGRLEPQRTPPRSGEPSRADIKRAPPRPA